MRYSQDLNWYAVRTRSQAEELARHGLSQKGFDLLMPTFQAVSRRKDRQKLLTKPIFKGYLFIRLQLDASLHLEVLKTLGVVEILKNSQGPKTIPNEEIDNIMLLEKHVGEFFEAPEFSVGEKVMVREGPLKGLKGAVYEVHQRMLRVGIESLPGGILIEIDPRQLISEESGIYLTIASA
ncbi:MAG: hypothetical protein MK441_08660 [SAR324 cluster bacterium]|nr:hypothetical protein [SAR324 cluster bacterium]